MLIFTIYVQSRTFVYNIAIFFFFVIQWNGVSGVSCACLNFWILVAPSLPIFVVEICNYLSLQGYFYIVCSKFACFLTFFPCSARMLGTHLPVCFLLIGNSAQLLFFLFFFCFFWYYWRKPFLQKHWSDPSCPWNWLAKAVPAFLFPVQLGPDFSSDWCCQCIVSDDARLVASSYSSSPVKYVSQVECRPKESTQHLVCQRDPENQKA